MKRSVRVSLVMLLSLAFVLSAFGAAAQTSPATRPGVPSNVYIINDDHVARLGWTAPSDSNVSGYKVTWGPSDSPAAHVSYTVFTESNLQPLDDTAVYQAQVQSVDMEGNLSEPASPASYIKSDQTTPDTGIQTDPTRVEALRRSLSGQFDDFNTAGPINPLNWFITADGQEGGVAHPPGQAAPPFSNSGTGIFPMTDQDHLHLYVSGDNQPGLVTMRALHPFDFSNRTGTISFDFDWGQLLLKDGAIGDNMRWFLVLSPTPVDDPSSSADGGRVLPPDQLRLEMNFTDVTLNVFRHGSSVLEVKNQVPFNRAINVRKPSQFKVSQNTADLFIDGVDVLHADNLNLPFSVAYIASQQWDYDLAINHIQAHLTHWDNIGFDAPAGYAPPVIHPYTDGAGLMGNLQVLQDPSSSEHQNRMSTTIDVPDSLSGASGAQVYLDFVAEAHPGATVALNGVSRPIPSNPYGDNLEETTRIVAFPADAVSQGSNTIALSIAGCNCSLRLNAIHLEVQFPGGSEVPYTAYAGLPSMDVPQQVSLGPLPILGTSFPASGSRLTGTVPVQVRADAGPTLLATGHVDAIVAVAVAIDGTPVVRRNLNGPTPRTDQTLQLDTTKIANGAHTLTAIAYGMDGGALATDSALMHTADFPQDMSRSVTIAN